MKAVFIHQHFVIVTFVLLRLLRSRILFRLRQAKKSFCNNPKQSFKTALLFLQSKQIAICKN